MENLDEDTSYGEDSGGVGKRNSGFVSTNDSKVVEDARKTCGVSNTILLHAFSTFRTRLSNRSVLPEAARDGRLQQRRRRGAAGVVPHHVDEAAALVGGRAARGERGRRRRRVHGGGRPQEGQGRRGRGGSGVAGARPEEDPDDMAATGWHHDTSVSGGLLLPLPAAARRLKEILKPMELGQLVDHHLWYSPLRNDEQLATHLVGVASLPSGGGVAQARHAGVGLQPSSSHPPVAGGEPRVACGQAGRRRRWWRRRRRGATPCGGGGGGRD
ncbi:Protein of unknown function [Gryllus bimaculatus]|nr:Protein of unknown function [Gryllus bimaculatus]